MANILGIIVFYKLVIFKKVEFKVRQKIILLNNLFKI